MGLALLTVEGEVQAGQASAAEHQANSQAQTKLREQRLVNTTQHNVSG
jgi:hypothetical protein